jgi:hypothetical protein
MARVSLMGCLDSQCNSARQLFITFIDGAEEANQQCVVLVVDRGPEGHDLDPVVQQHGNGLLGHESNELVSFARDTLVGSDVKD